MEAATSKDHERRRELESLQELGIDSKTSENSKVIISEMERVYVYLYLPADDAKRKP